MQAIRTLVDESQVNSPASRLLPAENPDSRKSAADPGLSSFPAPGDPLRLRSPLASIHFEGKLVDVIVIVMGVSGSGKTTVGRLLAERLGWEFLDADGFHPPANVAKMQAGTPLGDADRVAWLGALRKALAARFADGRSAVLACSALREGYRRELRQAGEPVRFVYLKGDYPTIHARIAARKSHYMPPSLLGSQFETLEEPVDAITVPVELSPTDAVLEIVRVLGPVAPDSPDALDTSDARQETSPRSHGP